MSLCSIGFCSCGLTEARIRQIQERLLSVAGIDGSNSEEVAQLFTDMAEDPQGGATQTGIGETELVAFFYHMKNFAFVQGKDCSNECEDSDEDDWDDWDDEEDGDCDDDDGYEWEKDDEDDFDFEEDEEDEEIVSHPVKQRLREMLISALLLAILAFIILDVMVSCARD